MTRWLFAAFFALVLPACAAQQTAMIECPASGCPSTAPIDPLSAELIRVVSNDLQCDASKLQLRPTGGASDDNGPWEAHGCGRAAVYRHRGDTVVRTSLIAENVK